MAMLVVGFDNGTIVMQLEQLPPTVRLGSETCTLFSIYQESVASRSE